LKHKENRNVGEGEEGNNSKKKVEREGRMARGKGSKTIGENLQGERINRRKKERSPLATERGRTPMWGGGGG